MQSIQDDLTPIWDTLRKPILSIGTAQISLLTIAKILIALILLLVVARLVRYLISGKLLSRFGSEVGTREAIGTIVQYLIAFFGVIVVLQTAGIDLSTLTVLSGTIGLGVGFGLQNIVNNFFSGIIILFERPIKIGDRIDVGGVNGDVVDISIRATSVRTNDNIVIIIPNSEFVSSKVINWSHTDRRVRFSLPVGVSYKSEPEKVREVLLSVAKKHPGVLSQPSPDVLFAEFGDSSLNFELRVWTTQYITIPMILRSELNFLIFRALQENGIEIPFPQRDLHLRSTNIPLWPDKEGEV